MSPNLQSELVQHLAQFVTENKVNLIDRVLAERTRHLTVMLEDVYHSHNASAVLRTCDCFGIQDMYITQKLHDYKVNPNIVRGASKWITLHKYERGEESNSQCIQTLKDKKYRLVGTTPDPNCASIHELDITSKTAIIFGTELDGVSEQTQRQLDDMVYIPMYGFTESFNVSVSVALVLQQLVWKLKQSEVKWQLNDLEKQALKFEWYQQIVKRADLHIKNYVKEHSKMDLG